MTSVHYREERWQRERRIREIGEGERYAEFTVDRGHKDGAEKHILTTNGVIIIYNAITNRLVTKLIARPGQIYRYYPKIIAIARLHMLQGLNRY